ncbi:MAG: glycoside hydrolase family 2 TIM barrel-domain containing protein [Maribacter sp.]
MKRFLWPFFAFIVLGYSCTQSTKSKVGLVTETDFNFDWQFKLTDSVLGTTDWREIRLPHDWSVEASFDSIKGEGATGYLPGGIGFYKKGFMLNLEANQMAYVLFDGVYNNSEVLLNGTKLGFHPYGYSPFYFNLTDALKQNNETNLLEVKVDKTRYADSRWYTGSGIYRNVALIVKNKLHIPIWGTYVTTPKVTTDNAHVMIEITVANNYNEDHKFDVLTEIFDSKGEKIAKSTTNQTIQANKEQESTQHLLVANPQLWDIETPHMYKAVTSIIRNGKTIDQNETPFGIRTIKFDADNGFLLNGKNRKIKGVCLHHDAGLVGAAVPKGVWERRLKKLREAGCNAIRVSHNPASKEFLDLCDEMGFLVQDEFFDEWDNPKDKRKNMNEQSVDYITRGYTEHFQEWAEKDLKNTVLAHRNHPSIIQWSIGNEIEWTYPRNADATGFFNNMDWSGNYFWEEPPHSIKEIKSKLNTLPKGTYDIGETAQKLAKWTKELDTTRYVIANCILPSASYESGYVDALDMVGYSYRRVLYDYGHENYPAKSIMGTENLGQWHEWKAVLERPFISGTYLWTGIDYMGESNGGWPKKGTSSGLLDLAGFEKPSYHMFKSLWNESPHIYLVTQTANKSIFKKDASGNVIEKKPNAWKQALWGWHDVNEHWNYKANEMVIAEVYSNCDEVELFLNNKSFGVKKLSDFEDHIYKWVVPFEEGTLAAKGINKEEQVETMLTSASEPIKINLELDKTELSADGYDVAHIVVQLLDENGNPVKNENRKITFSIEGNVKVLGVDNGAIDNVQDFQSNIIVSHNGRCLLIIQSIKGIKSEIKITALSNDLELGIAILTIK